MLGQRRIQFYLFSIFKIYLLAMLLSYFLVMVITNSSIKEYLHSPTIQSLTNILPKEAHLFLMEQEITPLRVYFHGQEKNSINWVKLATNVEIGDFRSLLGRELPGLERYHTEIIVAGEGTDIGNLPVESPPPTEEQLNNQEINQRELDIAQEKNPPKNTKEVSEKAVYIYHSHSWEAFKPLIKNKNASQDASSTNEAVNVIAVGSRLKNELESRGIGVDHNQTDINEGLKEKDWNYNNSYAFTRDLVVEALAQNQNLSYLIDIHRDSQPGEITTKNINGIDYARLFFVVGKENKNYAKNLMIAEELHNELERKYPGISRGVFVKTKSEGNGVYNQDLTERAILLEFGGIDNNLTELYNSVEAFAEVFERYYKADAEKVMADPAS